MNNSKPLADRIILVTGASRGIGRAAALHLADLGAHVLLIARSQQALEEVDDEITRNGGKCSLIVADLKDRELMKNLPGALSGRFDRLDGFLANAGDLGELMPVTDIQQKMWDQLLEINVSANIGLLSGLNHLFRASDSARIVAMTSGVATNFRPFWGPYAASKAAMQAIFLTYAQEKAETTIRTNLLNPGATRTVMREKAMPGEDPNTLPAPEELAPLIAKMLHPDEARNGASVSFRDWKEKN